MAGISKRAELLPASILTPMAEGLGIPTMAEYPDAPVLYWVGCAASYDDRAKKVARSTAKLMKAAGVEFTQEPVDRYGTVDAGFRDPSGNGWKMIQSR